MKNFIKKINEGTRNIIEKIRKKWITKTIMTVLLIAIIVAVFIALNMLVKKLNPKDIDVTKEKIHTISEQSVNIVKDLKNDINIYVIGLSDKDNIFSILDQYKRVSEKIKYEKIDDVTDRLDLATKYGVTNESEIIIVESGEKNKILTIADLYTYDYNTYKEIDLTEEAVTNAILDVTIEKKPQICFLTGHNVYDLESYLGTLRVFLTNEANEIQNVDLLVTGAVPETCDVLVMTTLKDDITEVERDRILDYINKGGKLLIMTDPLFTETEFTNFKAVLDVYGVSIQTNGIIFEQDADKMLYQSPELIRPVIDSSSEITKYLASDIGACFIDSTKLNFKTEEELTNLGVTVQNLVTAGENAFLRTNLNIPTNTKTEQDEDAGNSVLGAIIKKTIKEATNQEENAVESEQKADDGITSELIIFANNIFASDLQIPVTNSQQLVGIQFYNNKDLVLNSISYLTNRKDTLTIRKNMSSVTYTATELENRVIQAIIITIPILVVIVGIVVWQVRRSKK